MNATVIAGHWHVLDHYSAASALYVDERLMRRWVRRHGGQPVVEVVWCLIPIARCQGKDDVP